MHAFEKYLINSGWDLFIRDSKGNLISTTKEIVYSTYGPLDCRYIKDGKTIIFGLHEHGFPPTLIRPTLYITEIINNSFTSYPIETNQINRVLEDYKDDYSKLIDMLFNRPKKPIIINKLDKSIYQNK